MPNALAGRLLLSHFLDNIRGEPDPWEPAHVRSAHFEVEREVVTGDEPPQIRIVVRGRFEIETGERDVGWRRPLPTAGYSGRFTARVRFDARTRELVEWTALAEGRAFGRSRFTNGEPPGRFPLRIAFRLTQDPAHREIPPGMLFRGARQYWEPGIEMPIARRSR